MEILLVCVHQIPNHCSECLSCWCERTHMDSGGGGIAWKTCVLSVRNRDAYSHVHKGDQNNQQKRTVWGSEAWGKWIDLNVISDYYQKFILSGYGYVCINNQLWNYVKNFGIKWNVQQKIIIKALTLSFKSCCVCSAFLVFFFSFSRYLQMKFQTWNRSMESLLIST